MLNDGSGSFSKRIIASNMDWPTGVCAGDLNDDGRKDVIVVVRDSNQLIWLENNGGNNFSPHLIEEITKRLVQGLHPEKIILFGSHAYGKPTKESDIDLCVVVSDSKEPRYRRARKAYRYLRGLTAPIELIVLTSKEFHQGTIVTTSLINRIIHGGKVLYG